MNIVEESWNWNVIMYYSNEYWGWVIRMKHHLAHTCKYVLAFTKNLEDVQEMFAKILIGLEKRNDTSDERRW